DVIVLTVVDPHGAPVPRAHVRCRYETQERSGSGDSDADEHGRFRQFLDVRATYCFEASDPEGRFRPALAMDVPPGTRDLVLALGEKRSFRLKAEAEGRAPVERFRALVRLTRANLETGELVATPPESALEIVTPTAEF